MPQRQMRQNVESLFSSSAAVHGNLCPGRMVGVPMAMLGADLSVWMNLHVVKG